MSRSGGYSITGNELQAMVNEHIVGLKAAIPQNDYCLTEAQVYNSVYVYVGDAPSGSFLPYRNLGVVNGVTTVGVSPNYLANFSNINPIQASGTIVFEMNQVGNPYLNCDLFAQVNGSALRLDPGNSLDGMFFGGPQYSANMASAVKIGNQITIQANFGLDYPESPGNYGWGGNGYGVLEIYRNTTLISTQSTAYRAAIFSPNATQLAYSFIVESGVNYYVKAYPYVDNRIRATVNWASNFCNACNNASGQISVVGNDSTFCASTSFTSSNFNSFPAGNYVLSYGGNALNISTNGTSTATMYGGGCSTCVGTTADWTYVYQNCDGCVTRNIYKDVNNCSATYGQYKINPDGAAQVTAPSNTGACDTAQNWQDNGTVICIGYTNVTVYRNNNSCSSNYHFYRYTNPSTSATITQESDPSTGSCSTAADWVLLFGSEYCTGCTKHWLDVDINLNSATYGGTRISSVTEYNSTFCEGCCGQSTVAQWVIAFSSYSCSGCDKYYNEIDINTCSATWGNVRISSVLAESNSTYCCAPAACYQYYVADYGWVYFQDCQGYTSSYYMNPWDSFCAQQASYPAYQSGECGSFQP